MGFSKAPHNLTSYRTGSATNRNTNFAILVLAVQLEVNCNNEFFVKNLNELR